METTVLAEYATSTDAASYVRQVMQAMVKSVERPAAVFDVDATLLFNHPTRDAIQENRPIVQLLRDVHRMGLDIFIVTARQKSDTSNHFLRRQLQKYGIVEPKKIYMVNRAHADDPSPAAFKRACRDRIDKNGNTVILCVGDKWTDHFLDHQHRALRSTCYPHRYYLLHGDPPHQLVLKLPDYE